MNEQTPLGYLQARQLPQTGRRTRKPAHTFHLRHRPFQMQPFMLAPVLPGETLKNLLFQSRVVTHPIKNPLIGWWAEHYFFYVKLRDLDIRDDMVEMLMDPQADLSSHYEAASQPYYHFGGSINWAKHCVMRIADEYFRNEGESAQDFMLDGLPLAQAIQNKTSWLDSVVSATDLSFPDVDADINQDGTVHASEIMEAMAKYRDLLNVGLTEQTFEEYLRTFGVRAPKEELHKPELIRYSREWTYPSNTVDPTTGVPSSAASWSITQRADKDRFFSEPGFVFGLSIVRPKVYMSNQKGSAAGIMVDALAWLPAMLANDPRASLKQVPQGGGPLQNGSDEEGYWVDVKDLLMYGDQFVNFALTETNAGLVALPTPGLQRRYVSEADIDALFTGDNKRILQDGVVNLNILGKQVDNTRSV